MLPNDDVINLLQWSRQSIDDPLFRVAQKWIVDEQPERSLILEALQRISEVVHTESYKYQKFEIIRIRTLLLNLLNENKNFNLDLVEDSLAEEKNWDLKDYACLSLCLIMCLCVGAFQVL